MRGVVLLVVLAGCDLVFELNEPGVRRRTITLVPQISEPLVDRPISVYLDGDADLMQHMRADAKDVRFEIDKAPLPHELVAVDQPNGVFEAWVKIPLLQIPETTLEMLYGDDADLPPTAEDVWPDDVAAVWHLEQPGAALDSSPNGITLRPTDGEPELEDAGIVGAARRFAGGDRLCAGAPADFDPDAESFSYTMWVFVQATNGALDIPFGAGGDFAKDPGYNFELGQNNWTANLADGDEVVTSLALNAPMAGAWVQLAAVLLRGPFGSGLRTYVNATPGMTGDASMLGSVSSNKPTCLGSSNEPFTGLIDEVRIYRRALTADEIAVEHANLGRREQFIQIGDPILE